MNKSNRPVVVYGNDFSLNISVKRYDAQTDDYIDLDLSQVTDLEVYLTCSNNNTTIPLDFTTSGSIIKCEIQYRFLAPQTSYGIVVEAFDEENKHFRFEALPREGFLVVSNTSGFKPAENVDVIDIKARIGWGTVIDAYTKEEMDTKLEDYYDKEAVDDIVDPISERLSDAEGTLNDHTTQIDDLDNNIAINTADIATNKANITKNTNDIRALDEDVDSKQDILVSGVNIKTINNESILGEGNITIEGGGGSSEPVDYSKEYFTIESLADDNTITFTPYNDNVLSYSVNKGEWVEGNTVTANKGDNVRWKGELIPDTNENFSSGTFTSTKNINVKGNIMSLKHGDDFEGELTISDLNLFAKLFYKCRTLIDAHNLILPATRLSEESYSSMFTGCTALTKAPELPALTTAYGCYSHMFESCTALTKAPELPATTLAKDCYNSMFIDCTALTIAPKLPALVVADQCYMAMFKGCTALVEAPELPANTLATNCYLAMFEGCTKLVKAPDLPATTLQMQSYHKMFKGCSRLQSVKMMATSINAVQCLLNWMDNVSSTGTMLTDENITLPEGASGLPRGWKQITYIEKGALDEKQDVLESGVNIKTINNESILGEGNITIEGGGGSSEPVDYSKEYFTIESLADNNTITFIPYTIVNVLSYSTDKGTTWTEGNSVTVNKGDKVLWKGSNLTCGTGVDWSGGPGNFRSSGNIHLSGNIMSLEFGDGFASQTTLTKAHQFSNLFQNSKVVYAHNLILPATQLSQFCYAYMFAFSRSLVKAPRLQALSLAVQCYRSMFESCTSLQDAPELPATTLAAKCYPYMFTSCTALTNPPELPAVVLTDSCYTGMFALCSKLTVGPLLPAQVLAPTCYSQLFEDCTSIKYINMLATDISATNCLNSWVNRVGSTGTMITSGKVTLIKNSANGLPTGWTELQYADPAALAAKQDVLVSGTNIKTINNESILGEGNITIEGGGSSEPVDYSKEYFTIESLVDENTITFTPKNNNVLSYSIDDGTTWTEGNEVNVNNGDKVLWKGSDLSCDYGPGKFSSTGNIKVSGNIMSLEFGDEFVGQTTITKNYQFKELFIGCTSLIDAKDLILPATTLSGSCYTGMFTSCSLTIAPELPATTLATGCYNLMFYNCLSLVEAPELPATTLVDSCYRSMFESCTSLIKAPELPATTLANSCYGGMFYGCESLLEAPELPATTLATGCYYDMFKSCISLTKAPELPATRLTSYCCANMFSGCSKLSYVTMLATQILSSTSLENWMSNVASSGIMITSGKVTLIKNSANGIPTGWTELQYADPSALANKQDTLVSGTNIKTINNESILGEGNITIEGGGGSSEPADYSKEYFTIESLADDNTITFTPYSTNTLSYSTDDGTTWTSGNSVTVANGDKVLWKGSNLACEQSTSGNGCGKFSSTGNINVSGNIMSLEFGDEFVGKTTLSKSYQFMGLFKNCTLLIDTKDLILPATILSSRCYSFMFDHCTSLTKAPELPATTLAEFCYFHMFENCTSLVEAPEVLPASTLQRGCYWSMFYNCTSLVIVPKIYATTLASNCCQQMFSFCPLTQAPDLLATTLVSYCYNAMFQSCANIRYVKMLATEMTDSTALNGWLTMTTNKGTVVTSGKLTLPKDSNSGIPTGWTELQYTDQAAFAAKQDTLVSGTNIKTINNESILGSGNITIEGGTAPDLSNYATNAQLQTVDNKVNALDTNIDSIVDNLDNVTSTPTYTGTTTYSSVTEYQNDNTIFTFVKKNRWTVYNDCIYDYANTDYANNYNTMIVIPVTFTGTNNMIKLSVESYASSNPVGGNHSLCVGYLTATGISNVDIIDQTTTTGPSNTQNIPTTWYTVVNDLTSTLTPNGTWHIEETEIVPEYKVNKRAFVFILCRYVAIRNITVAQSIKPASFDKCIQSTTPGLKIEVVNALPTVPVENTIYLVRAVEYNLTTATSVSELEPGQGNVTYCYYSDQTFTPITSATAGQIIRVSGAGTVVNEDRPDYATEGVEGHWQPVDMYCDNAQVTNVGDGWFTFTMPAQDVYCYSIYEWIEQEQTEPEG